MLSDQPESFISLQEDSNQVKLAEAVDSYPYYAVAQFRLLSSYYKNQDKNFDQQLLKTALYFTNHRWLNWQLHNSNNIEKSSEPEETYLKIPGEQKNFEKTEIILNDKPELNSNFLPGEIKDQEIAFQPLYTVDYFASQGIKVNEETASNDKLGTQLKSFTEWLKSMKKIHVEKAQQSGDETDKIIQHIAETSNTNGNVVTEAMAEVLVKQGKIESAIEMYNKLSFKNPAKSAYFAAKIKSLKPD